MKYRLPLNLLAVATFATVFAARGADADTLRLLPVAATAPVGGEVSVALVLESEAGTLGGAVELEFDDASLALAAIEFDAAAGEPDFRCPTDPAAAEPVPCPENPRFVSFGAFDGIPAGTHTIATLTFDALAEGTSEVSARVTFPFADPVDLGSALPMSVEGTDVVVPEAGRVALMALLVTTSLLRRRRRA